MINGGAKPKTKSAAQRSAANRERARARAANAMSDGNAADDLADMFSAITLGRPTAVRRSRKVISPSERRDPSMRMRSAPKHLTYSPEPAKRSTAAVRRVSTGKHSAAHYKGLTERQSLKLAYLLSNVTDKKERAIIYKTFYAAVKAENKTMDDLSTMFGRI